MSTLQDNISNLSYTSKDFESIYPELLDLVKKLTDKWDPTTSNESDPGVVLIKLMALIGDKNNYNIDKNILETFPSSVTQFGNARKLYNELGYNLKWYQSATVNASFSVNLKTLTNVDTQEDIENSLRTVTIPRYTMFTTEDEDIVYTLIEKDVQLTAKAPSSTGICMQGVIQNYIINNSDLITLDNLDENRRLYFTETQVAENGIFIISGDWDKNVENNDLWVSTNNLAIEPSGKKVFQFGVLPNNNTCYIQFPIDVAILMKNGLKIKYLISNGEAGNIAASTLTKFYADTDLNIFEGTNKTKDSLKSNDIIIRNASSSVGGANPETLNSAYNNYKHTVGTFNTLVSCRDYENYIYNIKNDYNNYYVSNVKVTDRVNDLNSSQLVITLDNTGKIVKTLESKNPDNTMNAFNIRLYLLNNPPQITNDADFNSSFQQADTNIEDAIKLALEDTKSIQHDYSRLQNGDYFMVQNICNLTGNLVTYYKVTSSEAAEIEGKVKQALRETYNPRNLEWGKELNYDSLIQTIQNADKRIKSVILNEPIYTPYLIVYNEKKANTSVNLLNSSENANNVKLDLLASMIKSGNVLYFKFDDNFQYALGQVNKGISYDQETGKWKDSGGIINTPIINSIKNIKTELKIPITVKLNNEGTIIENIKTIGYNINKENIGYTVRPNENIYLTSPKLVTNTQYASGVNYSVTPEIIITNSKGEQSTEIPANSQYTLTGDQALNIYYTDSNNVKQIRSLKDITIQPSFNLPTGNPKDSINGIQRVKDENGNIYYTLTGNQSINICNINSQKLKNGIWCFWITNEVTTTDSGLKYILLNAGKEDYILKNNEYFIYTNNAKSELYILGSGTRISRFGAKDLPEISITLPNTLLLEDIVNEGLKSINDNVWVQYRDNGTATGGYPLTLTEMNIITLGEGAILKGDLLNYIDGTTTGSTSLSNVSYQINSNANSKPLMDISKVNDIDGSLASWKMVPVLNINSSPTVPQFVDSNQKITVNGINITSDEIDIVSGQYFLLNAPISLAGPYIDLTVTEIDSYGHKEDTNPISAYTYYDVKTNNSIKSSDPLKPDLTTNPIPDLTPILGAGETININKNSTLSNYNFTFKENTTYLMYVINNLITDRAKFTINNAANFSFEAYSNTLTDSTEININGVDVDSERVNFIYFRFNKDTLFDLFTADMTDWGDNDRVLISSLYVLPTPKDTNQYGVSDQIMETFGSNAINGEDTILKGLWSKLSNNDNDPNYDILYNVKGIDAINTELYGQNQGLFAAAALWDPNHLLNPYTLPVINTSEKPLETGDPNSKYNIKVAYSSKTT